MAKYDIHEFGKEKNLVVDLQTDLLDDLNIRVVAPLMQKDVAPKPAQYLNPIFENAGTEYVMVTQFLSVVPAPQLGQPVGNLSDKASDITRAIDMVFQGF